MDLMSKTHLMARLMARGSVWPAIWMRLMEARMRSGRSVVPAGLLRQVYG